MNRFSSFALASAASLTLSLGYASGGLACPGGDCDHNAKAAQASAASPAVTYTATLTVEGMSCEGCTEGLARAFRRQAGVVDAKVLFAKGQAQVTYDPTQTNSRALIAMVNRGEFKSPEQPASLVATAHFVSTTKAAPDAKQLEGMLKPHKGFSAVAAQKDSVDVTFDPKLTTADTFVKVLKKKGLKLAPVPVAATTQKAS